MADDVKVDEAAIRDWARNPLGPVRRMLTEVADEVARLARVLVPKRTGRTLRSIETSFDEFAPEGPSAEVSAGGAVLFLQAGTKPHLIRSHGDWSLESDPGEEYYGPIVLHPGSHKQPFLTTAFWSVHFL